MKFQMKNITSTKHPQLQVYSQSEFKRFDRKCQKRRHQCLESEGHCLYRR